VLDKNELPDIDLSLGDNRDISLNIPIACHYDNDMLLTKNGELIQILELDGVDLDMDFFGKNIRDSIRSVIPEKIRDFGYSVSIHNIRSRKNIMPKGKKTGNFIEILDKEWCNKNNFDKQLVNTVYISIIRNGTYSSIFNIPGLLNSLVFPLMKNRHNKKLKKAATELREVVSSILSELYHLSTKLLTIKKTDKGYISEPFIIN
jgi:type IV secretion system protein VirB4